MILKVPAGFFCEIQCVEWCETWRCRRDSSPGCSRCLVQSIRNFKSYDEPRQFGLRVNTLKISPRNLKPLPHFQSRRLPGCQMGTLPGGKICLPDIPFILRTLVSAGTGSAMTPASRLPVKRRGVLDHAQHPGKGHRAGGH